MKCKLTPQLSSDDWKDFCSRFHFSPADLPYIKAIYTALLPLVESCAYYSLDQNLDGISLPHYAYGFGLTDSQMLLPLKTAALILHLDTNTHADLRQLCNTCSTCKNLFCPSRKSPLQDLPHTYGAMQIFHIT